MKKCRICGGMVEKLFVKKVLKKYSVNYYKCLNCELVQTEKPYWLKEAYSEAIAATDVGLVSRNLSLASLTQWIINIFFKENGKFLDYGGGYGLFVRLMRDKGFNFFRYDSYCDNLFALYFDFDDMKKDEQKFELVTAFELMEHIVDPVKELKKIFSYTDNFLFSTSIYPTSDKILNNWWYLSTETGQHVSLYNNRTLSYIAKKVGLYYYSDDVSYHLFTRKRLKYNPFFLFKVFRLIRPGSRLNYVLKDYEFVKRKIS